MQPPIQTHTQRWRDGSASYRPAREVIDTTALAVASIPGDAEAKAFVERHHYSGSYPAARRRFGLYQAGVLVGVAVYSVPMTDIFAPFFDAPAAECVELGRLVLLDEIGANAETFFLAQTFRHLKRDGFAGVLAFSDPIPRVTAAGEQVFRGHIGTIYQAHNAHYLGRGTPRTLRLMPDAAVFSDRTAQKIRKQERGAGYAEAQLVAAGAAQRLPHEDPPAWLRSALAAVTRPMRHHGNHRYGWALRRRAWRDAAARGTYPKQLETTSPP